MTAHILPTPIERVEILTVIDNVVDVLLPNTAVAKRMATSGRERRPLPRLEAPLLEEGHAADSPFAEKALSFLVTVFFDGQRHSLLLDTGATVGGAAGGLLADTNGESNDEEECHETIGSDGYHATFGDALVER